MKRIFSLLLAFLLLCFCSAGCTPAGRANSAAKFINKDLEGITALAEKILETGQVPEDVFYDGVESVGYAAPNWVEFVTGSRDGSQAARCGFYYSPDDQPIGFEGTDMELTADQSGWAWQGSDEGNRYYTERIQYNWYYYEMFF